MEICCSQYTRHSVSRRRLVNVARCLTVYVRTQITTRHWLAAFTGSITRSAIAVYINYSGAILRSPPGGIRCTAHSQSPYISLLFLATHPLLPLPSGFLSSFSSHPSAVPSLSRGSASNEYGMLPVLQRLGVACSL